LPFIEDHPISIRVGHWTIDEAVRQMRAWRTRGISLSVGVNVGVHQLQHGHLMEKLTSLFEETPDFAPRSLEIEVLESSVFGDIDKVLDVITKCKDLGVRFALDDFGTGYSSLTHLRKLPTEVLKIDQSFVRDMLVNPDNLVIVQGVTGLAFAFNRKVTLPKASKPRRTDLV